MYQSTPASHFQYLLAHAAPAAVAWIQGNASQPQLAGSVKFYQTSYGGVLMEAEIFGLPNIHIQGSGNFYGMHIHEYGNCTIPFDQTGNHYNPDHMPILSMPETFPLFWAIRAMHIRCFMTNGSSSMPSSEDP